MTVEEARLICKILRKFNTALIIFGLISTVILLLIENYKNASLTALITLLAILILEYGMSFLKKELEKL